MAVRKALIPVAGQGTRLRPLTRVVPKALFPLVDGAGRARSVLHVICAAAGAAGIEEVGVIASPAQAPLLRQYFDAARQAGAGDLPRRIEYVIQPQPAGFGQAVLCGKEFVGRSENAFMVLLGDHVYTQPTGQPPCPAQVASAFDSFAGAGQPCAAMIGMQVVEPEELSRVGVAAGEPIGPRIYRCRDFIEKPSLEAARQRLVTPDLPPDHFLAHCGIYIFTTEVFDCLEELARRPRTPGEEIQLADAQGMLLARHPGEYYLRLIHGQALDTGTPQQYAKTFAKMADTQ